MRQPYERHKAGPYTYVLVLTKNTSIQRYVRIRSIVYEYVYSYWSSPSLVEILNVSQDVRELLKE